MRCSGLPVIVISVAFLLSACTRQPFQETAEIQPGADAQERDIIIAPEPELTDETVEELAKAPADPVQTAAQYADAPGDDLWRRIGANLNMPRHLDHRSVKGRLAWYARNQEYLDRVTERSRPYLFHVVSEVEKRGFPLELALLPIVESAFHPFAYSRSHASGIWQFIPSTGKIYGLKQNWWYDGRRDIVAATRAALDYLDKLNKEFGGDWLLALAAYNTGERNVARAIRRNERAGKNTDFFSLRLPRETKGYVPSLLAVAELVANPEQHGIVWQPVADQQYFAQVDTGEQIDLAVAAQLAGQNMDELYTLNPGFNRWATDPQGPHRILVPVAREQSFRDNLAGLSPDERMNWQSYEIKRGDTLAGIAARYRSSVTALKHINKLRGNTIHQGNTLRVPVPQQALRHYTLSVEGRRLRGLKDTGDGNKFVYTIKRGDTLWDIGRKYGVTVKQLTGWNGISARKILRPGQKLNLWFADDGKQAAAATGAPPSKDPFHYTVKRGDSLSKIAKKFSVTLKQLLAWNNLRKHDTIYPNQKITVYRSARSVGI